MRSPWVLVSIVSHSLVITAAAIAPLVASVDLPDVHSPLAAYIPAFAKDIPLPPLPRRPGSTTSRVDPNAPPSVIPTGIAPESVRQQAIDAGGLEVEGGLQPIDQIPGAVVEDVIRAPQPPREQPPVPVSQGIRAPRKIVDVAPMYPAIALSAHREGVVILEAIIDTRGYVKDVRVLRSIPLLDEAAMDAVRQWRYTPTLLNGQPVSVIMTVTVNFRLGK